MKLQVTEAPAVQVASLEPPAVYGQQHSLNVEAPAFEPRSLFEAETRASPNETCQAIPISAEDRHEQQNKDHNGINAKNDGDSNITLPFVNCTTEELKDILCDQITVEHMRSKLAAAQSKVREYQCDIYDCFDLILAKGFSITIDEKLPELMESVISLYETVQRHTDDENLTLKNEISQLKNELNLNQQEFSEAQSKISKLSTSIQGMKQFQAQLLRDNKHLQTLMQQGYRYGDRQKPNGPHDGYSKQQNRKSNHKHSVWCIFYHL